MTDIETHDSSLDTQSDYATAVFTLAQLQQYDGHSWNVLLQLYASRLRQDILQSLKRRDLPLDIADDIEQETWLTAIRLIKNVVWENEEMFYHWFRCIATNHIRNVERELRKTYVSLQSIDDESDDSGLSLDLFMYVNGLIEDSPENRVALEETLSILDSALKMLKPREREILLRRIVNGETPQQMASYYGVKPQTISVILVRAKNAVLAHIVAMNR
jgi:RNA polymerase sigma factor (sigma-70 family)